MKGLLLLLLILTVSCDQLSGSSDNNSSKRTTQAESPTGDITPDEPSDLPEPTPDPQKPNCEVVCSKPLKYSSSNTGFDYLSFPNFGYRGIGRCRGHALVMQKFSMLAEFDDTQSSCDTGLPNCWARVKAKIDKVLNYQTSKIRGFSDLYDFSRDRRVRAYLWSKVAGTSHRYRATTANMRVRRYAHPHLNVFHELKNRVNDGHLPYVGVVGPQTGAHALLIYGVENRGARTYLCARDPNMVSGSAENCEHKIFVHTGRVYYQRNDRTADLLSFFKLTSDEDQRIRRYEVALKSKCMRVSRAANICK